MSKRILVLSDLHCGHVAGLTPPAWQLPLDPEAGVRHALALAQREAWEWYRAAIAGLQPFHAVFFLGDAIDGRGEKSGGCELLTTDREEQCRMAARVLKEPGCGNGAMVYGTGYHVGDKEQWENLVARELKWPVGAHDWPRINGVTFDLKHHLGSSQIPYGRHTAVSRDRLQNILWDRDGAQPSSDIIIRGHTHYYQFAGGCDGNPPRRWAALTCPALQLPKTRFGDLRCSATVHFGIVTFDVAADGSWDWQERIAPLKCNRAEAREM